MADLAIRLVVFIASPGDLSHERDIVEEEVRAVSELGSEFGVQLDAFRWEDGVTPGFERRLQERLTRELRTAELTIVMFWYRLGSAASVTNPETGSSEELRIAGERVAKGYADDVFLYFKQAPPPPGASPADLEAVRDLRRRLDAEKQLLTADFTTTEELRRRVRRDLTRWSQRWFRIREVCTYLLRGTDGASVPSEMLGEAMLTRLIPAWESIALPTLEAQLGETAWRAYQIRGHAAFRQAVPLARAAAAARPPFASAVATSIGHGNVTPFVMHADQVTFSSADWFFFFCALGLIDSILADRVESVSARPYINPIHQLLSAIIARRRIRSAVSATLRRWLVNADGVTASRPIARNFAAYVLGMIGAIEAQDDLAEAMAHDNGEGVRIYCITSLGKLRARRHLPTLLRAFDESRDAEERSVIAQSLCRMTGLVNYEL